MPRPNRSPSGRLPFGAAIPWWRRARWRWWRWAAAGALVVIAGTAVQARLGQAGEVVAELGTTRAVVVARRDLEPGHVIADDDGVVRRVPVAVVPDSAVDAMPTGRVVTQTIVGGEIVSADRLGPAGLGGLAALVPAGHRAVAVPTGDASIDLRIGDRVDVLDPTIGDRYGESGSAHAEVVARGALVIAAGDRTVTVAVDADEAGPIAAALGRGNPVLALAGAQPDG